MGDIARPRAMIHLDMSHTLWPPDFHLLSDGTIKVVHDATPGSMAARHMELLEAELNESGRTVEIEAVRV